MICKRGTIHLAETSSFPRLLARLAERIAESVADCALEFIARAARIVRFSSSAPSRESKAITRCL